MLLLTPIGADPERLAPFPASDLAAIRVMSGSLLDPSPCHDPHSGADLLVWSGTLARRADRGPFDADPGNWSPRAWEALRSACAAVAARTRARILVRPHARHIVSDLPGIECFARQVGADHPGRFAIALDPASMLDQRHVDLGVAPDTLRRIAEAIPRLGTPDCPLAAVIIANARTDGDRLAASAIDDGMLDPLLIRSLFAGPMPAPDAP